LKSDNGKLTGKWDCDGVFTGVFETPSLRLEGRFGSKGIEGKGKMVIGDYSYEGDFVCGNQHGEGKSKTGNQEIKGRWKGGKLQVGVLTQGDTRYRGGFEDNHYHGWGRLERPGLFYEGNFSHEKFEGHGTYRYGGIHILGTFRNRNLHFRHSRLHLQWELFRGKIARKRDMECYSAAESIG